MYCPECGTPNPDSSEYCANCGAELVEHTGRPQQSSVESLSQYAQEVKSYAQVVKSVDYQSYIKGFLGFLNKYKKILIPVICVIVVLCVAGKIGSSLSSPERIAEKYFESLVDSDYDKMFDYVMVNESDFIDEERFVKYMENVNPLGNKQILNYSMGEPYATGEMVTVCTVSYLLEGSIYENEMEIPLMKQSKKTMLFFDSYKVGLENILSTNFTVTAPEGLKVEIDGIEVKGQPTDEGYAAYVVDRFFDGEYTIKITGDLIEEFTDKIYMSTNDSYYASGLVLNQNTVTALQNKAQESLRLIFEGVTSGKPYALLQMPEWISPEIAETYESLLSNYYHEDGTGLAGVSFADFKVEEAPAFNTSGDTTLYLKYKSTTVMNSKAWFSEEIETSTNEKDTGSTFRFVLVDGEWMLEAVDNLYIH